MSGDAMVPRAPLSDDRSASEPGRPPTVLLADDNEAILETMAECLTIAGFRVLTARDGIEAVEVLSRHPADIGLAILDVAMPQIDGIEALERMREIRPDLPVLFSTAQRSSVLNVLDPLPEGVGIISKPFRMVELLRVVREALGGG